MPDARPRRLAALAEGLTAAHVDGLLVTSLANIRYLTGFSGSSGLLFVSPRDTVFITDFRYQTQVRDEIGDLARIAISDRGIGIRGFDRVDQLSAHARGPRVELLGPVEREQHDLVALLLQDLLVFHARDAIPAPVGGPDRRPSPSSSRPRPSRRRRTRLRA